MSGIAEPNLDARLVRVLSDFARTVVTDFPIQAILDHLVGQIADMLPVDCAGVTLISASLAPRYVAASDASALVYERLQSEVQEGPCLLAYSQDAAVRVPDLHDDSRFPRFSARALHAGLGAVFTFPLRHGENRLGALDLYRTEPGELSDSMAKTAQILADVAAAYLINAQARVDLQATSDHSRQVSLHDALTGLPNRTLMLERLTHAFQRLRRTGRIAAVLFIDLDGFKAVNDRYGHAAGDDLLVAVTQRLVHLLRPSDTLARIHGDEFVLLCEDLAGPGDAADIGRRLQAALAEPFTVGGASLRLSASVGVAHADAAVHDPEGVLRNADIAMYEAKRLGGNRFWVYDPRYQHLTDGRDQLQRDLVAAVSSDQLHNDYQPIVDTATGDVAGFEALLRWTHPQRGLLAPLEFIPLAEHAGLIDDLGRIALAAACSDRRTWPHPPPGRSAVGVSVNVSTPQLMTSSLVDNVVAALSDSGTDPGLLTLEITESVFIRDARRASTVLHDLKDVGVRIALDDFGTGYSSLSYLNQFPVDVVKIDRSFVADLSAGSVNRIITAAVVELAHSLKMTVVAEGIETADQRDHVRALGCDFSQGFYYARPLANADASRYLDHERRLGPAAVTSVFPFPASGAS